MYSDPAAGSHQQHIVVRIDLRALAHAVPVGVDGIGGDRRSLVIEAVRDWQEITGGQTHEVSEAAIAMDADEAAEILAQCFAPAMTPAAMPAIEVKVDGAAIAGLDVGDAVADSDNVAAEFVTHDARRFAAEAAAAHVEQRQPDTGGADLHDGFTGARLRIRPFLKCEGLPPLLDDHRAHAVFSPLFIVLLRMSVVTHRSR